MRRGRVPRGWRPFVLVAILVLPLLAASAPSPRPIRAADGTLAATTTITWSGTTGIRLKIPHLSRMPEDGVQLWAGEGTDFAFVRMIQMPQPVGCELYELEVCAIEEITWLRVPHGSDAGAVPPDDRSRRRDVIFGEPAEARSEYLDVYLFSDGPVTLRLQAPDLEGEVWYEPTGLIQGTAHRLPVSCLPEVCCPTSCPEDSSIPDLPAGPTMAFGGVAHDVGDLGYVASFSYSRNEPRRSSKARGIHVCVYPSWGDPEASPDPDRHPLGCDEVPEPRAAAIGDRVEAGFGDFYGINTFQLEASKFNSAARGMAYAGFRADSLGPDPAVNAGYGLWFSYGIAAPVTVERLAGVSRQQTAVAVARHAFPDDADTVVLARADTYPDALAGAPLAFQEGAPILLTSGQQLDTVVVEEIGRLGADRAILLGGVSALSQRVEEDLAALGVDTIERVAGPTRWATSAAIAERLDPTEAFIVAADDPDRGWPDALAVGAIAASRGSAILLVRSETIPAETRTALGGIDRAVIVGGSAAVSEAVETELRTFVDQVERVAGATRYATNVALLDRYSDDTGPLWVATGLGFPDALAAGPAVAATAGRLLLVDGRDLTLSPTAHDWYRRTEHPNVLLIGGPTTLTPNLEDQLQ